MFEELISGVLQYLATISGYSSSRNNSHTEKIDLKAPRRPLDSRGKESSQKLSIHSPRIETEVELLTLHLMVTKGIRRNVEGRDVGCRRQESR